jgi:hypothetical protein
MESPSNIKKPWVKTLFGEKLSNWREVCLYFESAGKIPSVWNTNSKGTSCRHFGMGRSPEGTAHRPPGEPWRKEEEHELLIATWF